MSGICLPPHPAAGAGAVPPATRARAERLEVPEQAARSLPGAPVWTRRVAAARAAALARAVARAQVVPDPGALGAQLTELAGASVRAARQVRVRAARARVERQVEVQVARAWEV